jgi:uncharacterized damage-inducible protein DinB
MSDLLAQLFAHNHWANLEVIRACAALSDRQLDAEPQSATKGSIRGTLIHLVAAQQGYLSLLTLPVDERRAAPPLFAEPPTLVALEAAARTSGEALLALVQGGPPAPPQGQLETTDGYVVEPWVVLVQVINHATEHREQIKSMLSALGVTPPGVDGWNYGEATGALALMAA